MARRYWRRWFYAPLGQVDIGVGARYLPSRRELRFESWASEERCSVPLGQFLGELGIWEHDCHQALEVWRREQELRRQVGSGEGEHGVG